MNELIEKEEIIIENIIYEIRGKQVMLDSDLAKLYECKNGTKDINKAVKRNINRFPEDFYFQLTEKECSRFQNGTLNIKRGQNIKYLPHKILLLEDKVDNNTKRINELFDMFDPKVITRNYIFYKGEFFDAYILLWLEIFDEAKEEIIIINNYASKELLKILKDINKKNNNYF